MASFSLSVQVLPGPSITLGLEKGENTTVAELKQLVAGQVESCADKSLLVVHRGKRLDDATALADAGVSNGEKIFVAVAPEQKQKQEKESSKAQGNTATTQAATTTTTTTASTPEASERKDGFDVTILVVGKGKESLHLPKGEATTVAEL